MRIGGWVGGKEENKGVRFYVRNQMRYDFLSFFKIPGSIDDNGKYSPKSPRKGSLLCHFNPAPSLLPFRGPPGSILLLHADGSFYCCLLLDRPVVDL